uniref:Serine hydrolase domain-containing protein n=1 Tax=Peronospora matthiolae TaxID=2874970 RepID=A0AAV1TQW5_9STRA
MTTLRVTSRATGRKLRLLCLHGIYQDAETFTVKTKPLRGVSGTANVDFVFLDGPFSVVPPILTRPNKRLRKCPSTSRQKKKSEYRAWWRPLGIHEEVDAGRLARDWDVLVSFLREQIDEIGDVDGVFGFSQGASLAAWMCSKRARAELRWSPKVAVLIGSYVGSPQFSLDSGIVPDISSLHIFGSNDYVIPTAKSQQVVDIFKQQQTVENCVLTSVHAQGHVIPKCDECKELFESFLIRQQLRLLSRSTHSSSMAVDCNNVNALEVATTGSELCSSPATRWSPPCSHVSFQPTR